MKSSRDRRRRRHQRLWPTVNYYAELRPVVDEQHPIDALLDESPVVRRAYRRVRELEPPLSSSGGKTFRDYADARLHLQSVREDLAFNLGIEVGATAARAEVLRSATPRRVQVFRAAARRFIRDDARRASERLLASIESSWALARGPVSPESVLDVVRPGRPGSRGTKSG